MQTILIQTDEVKAKGIKQFLRAFGVGYKIEKKVKPYNEDFVKKIEKGDEDLKNGRGRTVTLEELEHLWK